LLFSSLAGCSPLSVGRALLEEIRRDEALRRELALELAAEIAGSPEARLAILEAVLREVATKQDLEKTRAELREEIEKVKSELRGEIERVRNELRGDMEKMRSELRGEIDRVRGEIERVRSELKGDIVELRKELRALEAKFDSLEIRLARVEASLTLLTRMYVAFNVPLLVAVIGILITLLWRGAP